MYEALGSAADPQRSLLGQRDDVWKPARPTASIVRSGRIQDVEDSLSEIHVILNKLAS